jgi:hypothetical protein
MHRLCNRIPSAIGLVFAFAAGALAQTQHASPTKTQVVMLGTGTPLPDPDRAGPSTALIVNGTGTSSMLGPVWCVARRPRAIGESKPWNRRT